MAQNVSLSGKLQHYLIQNIECQAQVYQVVIQRVERIEHYVTLGGDCSHLKQTVT